MANGRWPAANDRWLPRGSNRYNRYSVTGASPLQGRRGGYFAIWEGQNAKMLNFLKRSLGANALFVLCNSASSRHYLAQFAQMQNWAGPRGQSIRLCIWEALNAKFAKIAAACLGTKATFVL